MPLYKNTAGQKLAIVAIDTSDGSLKTGDAGNITAQISLDGGASAATDDTNPTELDSTNHPGVYLFDMLQAETDADLISLNAVSATGNVSCGDPQLIYTEDTASLVWDEILTGATHNISTSAGKHLRNLTEVIAIDNGTAQAGSNTSITLEAGAPADNDFYKGMLCVLIGSTGAGQARAISAYDGATKIATIRPAWAVNPDATSEYSVLSFGSSVVGAISDEALTEIENATLSAANTELAAIPASTAGLRTMIQHLFEKTRHKEAFNKDTGVSTLYKDDGTTPLGTSTSTDDGTTVIRGEMT